MAFDIWDDPQLRSFGFSNDLNSSGFADIEDFRLDTSGDGNLFAPSAQSSRESGSYDPIMAANFSAAVEREGEEIVVTGRIQSDPLPPSGGGGRYVLRQPGDGGGGDGDGGASNTDFAVSNDDATCQDGAAVNAADAILDLVSSEGNFEFAGLLV